MFDTLLKYSVDSTGEAWGISNAIKRIGCLHLYVYSYGFSYLVLNSDWPKSRGKQAKKIITLI